MENDKELEKLIEKSRIQIEEREKVLRELMQARELDEKRRALQQLTTETELLQGESKRLKSLIEQDNQALANKLSGRPTQNSNGQFNNRNFNPGRDFGPSPRDFSAEFTRPRDVSAMQRPTNERPFAEDLKRREHDRSRDQDQSKFNEALLEVTREIKAELARQRASTEEVRNQKSANEDALYQELKALREEVKARNEQPLVTNQNAPKVVDITPNLNQYNNKQRDFAIDELQNEIHQIQAELAKAQKVTKANAVLEEESAKLNAETRKLRTDLDRQKVDNFKRDRDMTRVINLLEKMADEDEE